MAGHEAGGTSSSRNGPAPRRRSTATRGSWASGRWRRARSANARRPLARACEAELRAADDISLLLPGNRGDEYRRAGISTIRELARTDAAGEDRYRAAVRHRRARRTARARDHRPRADVEIDVDLEAYPAHGAYLWGACRRGRVRAARDVGAARADGLGGTAEAENFARFWDWLMERRAAAVGAGRTFRAYCWAAEGENHWLRHSAKRFAGLEFVVEGESAGEPARIIAVPDVAEIERFISSDEWVDLFRVAKRQLISPAGLGLKVVAPMAGFSWRDEDADGEASLSFYRDAVGIGAGSGAAGDGAGRSAGGGVGGSPAARAKLLRYNGDDCRSTAVVRDWLDSGRAAEDILSSTWTAPPTRGSGRAPAD